MESADLSVRVKLDVAHDPSIELFDDKIEEVV